jgi:nitroreductase
MELQESITKRRSIRSFTKKTPDWREILYCLDTTRFAPKAGGYSTLKFLILDDKKKIQEIAKWSEQDFISKAPYLIFFISDTKIIENAFQERAKKFSHQQAGAAIQNFLLSVTEMGLSTCWIGYFNDEKIKKILKIPEKLEIEAFFPVGFEKTKPKTRKLENELFNRTYFNEWGNKRLPGKFPLIKR